MGRVGPFPPALAGQICAHEVDKRRNNIAGVVGAPLPALNDPEVGRSIWDAAPPSTGSVSGNVAHPRCFSVHPLAA